MDKFGIKNIIFDLDGTLINSAGDVVYCLKEVYGLIPEFSNVEISESFIGPPLNELIKKITPSLNEEQTSIVIREFRNCYDNSSFLKTRLYEGVCELIHDLKQHNIKIFITTNKPFFATKKILKNLMIDDFDDVVSLDVVTGEKMNKTEMVSYLINKWGIEKDTTLMVGDDASDIIAAHNNGLRSVAILDGYGDANMIYKAKPLYAINSINDFYNLFMTQLEF
ncbi:MAG: HAD family hydrolase [Proteobacteria bacterium]|nr:HAD family hydrolase [Pseudomonadota bacterium]